MAPWQGARSARVGTSLTTFMRPVTKLCFLESDREVSNLKKISKLSYICTFSKLKTGDELCLLLDFDFALVGELDKSKMNTLIKLVHWGHCVVTNASIFRVISFHLFSPFLGNPIKVFLVRN